MKYAAVNNWSGLVVGQGDIHHRGLHSAVIERKTGRLIALCGPADDQESVSDARRIACLLNQQTQQTQPINATAN